MTAAAANRRTRSRHPRASEVSYPVAASTTIYQGTLVMLVAGYLVPAADTAGGKVVGIAQEYVVNAGAAGAEMCLVSSGDAYHFTGSSIVQADVGKLAYVADDSTVQDAVNTNGVVAGRIEGIDADGGIWVFIPPAGMDQGAGLRVSVSAESTGTGSAQNVAHTLGVAPTHVLIAPTDLTAATVGQYVVTEGTHTATNVVVTVTTGKKFRAIAFG